MKALICCNNPAGFRLVADSAFGRNGQPWFVPEFGNNWRWTAMLALRVGRLGKRIAPKFASRYVDAMTLLFVPGCDAAEAEVLLSCMDGGAIAGEWQAIADRVHVDDGPISVSFDELDVPRFVAHASRYVTLKTGDILAVAIPGIASHPAEINSKVSIKLNGLPALGFNIK